MCGRKSDTAPCLAAGALNDRAGIGKRCFHIAFGQFGIRREEISQIGILSKVGEHALYGDARPLDD